MTAFLIVGLVGAALLIASTLLGDLLGMFDIGDGLISGASVGAGLTFFGIPGYLVLGAGGPLWLALAAGVVLAAAAMLMIRTITRKLADSSQQEAYELVGLAGVTTEATTATYGEVKLSHPREINKRLAFSSETLPAGASVIVTETLGSKVKVASTTTEGLHS
jgi:membrane protein implicated in regulation of membrane protease activity